MQPDCKLLFHLFAGSGIYDRLGPDENSSLRRLAMHAATACLSGERRQSETAASGLRIAPVDGEPGILERVALEEDAYRDGRSRRRRILQPAPERRHAMFGLYGSSISGMA
jgi:hypothetical protein